MAKRKKQQHDFKLNMKNDGKVAVHIYSYLATPLCHAQNKNKEFIIIKSHFYDEPALLAFPTFTNHTASMQIF